MFSRHPCQGQSAGLLTSVTQHPGHGRDSEQTFGVSARCTALQKVGGGHLSSEQAGNGVGTLKGTSVQCLFLMR